MDPFILFLGLLKGGKNVDEIDISLCVFDQLRHVMEEEKNIVYP